MKITNQKPAELSCIHPMPPKGSFDPKAAMRETLADPLYTSLIAGTPVEIKSHGNAVSPDDVVEHVLGTLGELVNATEEDWCKELYGKSLVYYNPNTTLQTANLFAIQSAKKAGLPEPSPVVVYTPATDVIPVSKEFLAGKCDYDKYFATMAFFARPRTLGFYFANKAAFDNFRAQVVTQATSAAGIFPAQTNQLFQDFAKLDLDGLTESLVLRNDDSENNDEFSFARCIVSYAMLYAQQANPSEMGPMPFDLGELYCPKTIVFVNVERHTHATAKQINDEWDLINNSIAMKIQMVSNNQLNKLTAMARNIKKAQAMAANTLLNQANPVGRSANIVFSTHAPNAVDIARVMKKVMNKMADVNMSENSYKSVKMSFAKPNRREPDNFNKQGKSVSTRYKPDIHLYIDTSGSVSEENYKEAVQACIVMAHKLNVNLYFNSFSSVLSQCTKLNTKDKSQKQVYAQFLRVPKVTGGTDYEQIWHYINRSKKRLREISLCLTDFEYWPPNHYVKHPKNLYYLPLSRMDWNQMVSSAKEFCKNMQHIDPGCRKHLLF